MSVAYRSTTMEGRKRMNARDNPKENEKERERESKTWSKLESEGSVWFISSFTTGPRSRSSRFSRAVQSSRSSWNLDQKFLWNPMEFSVWSMSLISPRELWFISFWETPTWPWVYYLNFMWDYLGWHICVFSRCSKIFTIAEIFWIFLFLFFLTHTLILFYNNMIFNILSSKITFILFLLLSSRILFLASFASIISIKQFRTNQTHQISNVKDPRLITINDKKKKKKKRKEKTFNPKQSSENNPNFCNQFIFKITKFPYLFSTFPFYLLDTFHPPYPEL